MTKKENEILSRRSFFKKAAGIVIPAVAMVGTSLSNDIL